MRTGWTFEYVDDLSLKRALEFVDYARREAAAEAGDEEGARSPRAPWTPPTEEEVESQMALTAAMIPPGIVGREMKIPEHYRDAIRWAEEEKKNRGLN